jgi:hypothetical protein
MTLLLTNSVIDIFCQWFKIYRDYQQYPKGVI